MNWQDQTRELLKLWSNARQQMMNNWTDLARSAPRSLPPADPAENASMSEVWRAMTLQGIRAWMQEAAPAARHVAEQMFASQTALIRLLQLTLDVWAHVSPAVADTVQGDGDWQGVLAGQMEKVRADLLKNSSASIYATHDLPRLWEAYIDQAMPWPGGPIIGGMRGRQQGSGDAPALIQMSSLYWDAYQDTFGTLLQTPGSDVQREIEDALQRAFTAWLEVGQSTYAYQAVLADAWVLSFEKLMRELVTLAREDKALESLRALLERWNSIAGEVFKETFRSDPYTQAQGRLVNASMQYRIVQRTLQERILNLYDLPTRTELDEAHRRIYELRRELRALRREVKTLRAEKTERKKPPPTDDKTEG